MTVKLKTNFFIIMFLIFSSCVNAGIYKWVDENGVTHFGNQPPAQKESKELKEDTGNSFKAHRDNNTSRSRENMNSYQRNAQKGEESKHIDCYAAVDNTKSSFKSVREVGREKYKRGDMSYEKYKKGVENLRKANSSVSRSDCEKSKGKKREFYQCMHKGSGDASQAVLCALMHKFK